MANTKQLVQGAQQNHLEKELVKQQIVKCEDWWQTEWEEWIARMYLSLYW